MHTPLRHASPAFSPARPTSDATALRLSMPRAFTATAAMQDCCDERRPPRRALRGRYLGGLTPLVLFHVQG
jgi:hypothetical protein